jgi:1,4-dihydroxy-2-naphthoate octaprenyltransferase
MSRQTRSAHLALSMGAVGLIGGMVYGTQIGSCPYPQLALGAHVQFMVAGMLGILAGLVLNSQSLCQLNDAPLLLLINDLAHYLLLVPCSAEGYYAFKGLGMPLVDSL